jgi:hypothetical protein
MRGVLAQMGVTSTPAALSGALTQQSGAAVTDAMVNTVMAGALAKVSSASVGGSIQTLQIMSTTKAAATAAVVFACVGGLWLRHDYAELRTAESELETRTMEYRNILAQLEAKKAAARPMADAVTTPSASVATVSPQSSAATTENPATASAARASGASTPATVNWTLSRDPEIRATLSTWIKSSFHSSMAAFYRQAGLTPEQIGALEDLQMESNISMGPGALLTLRPEEKTIEQVTADVRRLLGEQTYQQFRDYAQSQFLRPVSIGVAGLVYDSETPMTAPQADQLTQILRESTSAGRSRFPKDVDWSQALPRAKALLPPAQYAALETIAATLKNASAAVNAIAPGTFGDGVNPPPSLFNIGPKPK